MYAILVYSRSSYFLEERKERRMDELEEDFIISSKY